MAEATFVIKNETGLHARPASLFVQKAAKFKSTIKVKKDGKEMCIRDRDADEAVRRGIWIGTQ